MKRISAEKKNQARSMLMTGSRGFEVAETLEISESSVNKIRKQLQDEGHQIWHLSGGKVSSTLR